MAERNFENRTLFKGDNLDFLRGMNSQTVDLIATDPPFNKGKDFHATPESLAAGARFQDRWTWDDDTQPEWVDAIKDDKPRVYSLIDYTIGGLSNDTKTRKKRGGREDISAFLCFMGVRLIEMRRVLKDTGSLYLHCDPTASHYLKALMDAVFGDKQFRNEIIWHYYNVASVSRAFFGRKHDILLVYSKGRNPTFNWDDMREEYAPNSNWVKNAESYNDDYRPNTRGKLMHDVWRMPTINNMAKERTGYPTQKPLALYERIIKASSNEGDMVLDPFCGCATTPIAAERLRRQWVGMDLWDGAYDIVKQRMDDNMQLLADPNPRIIFWDKEQQGLPIRTDGGEDAPAFVLELRERYPKERWQTLSHKEMRDILVKAQASATGHVNCAGCGISLPAEYFELDHITPRAEGGENWITNRVLLCSPCNRIKSADLTIRGLHRHNKRERRMYSERDAITALNNARAAAQKVKRERGR